MARMGTISEKLSSTTSKKGIMLAPPAPSKHLRRLIFLLLATIAILSILFALLKQRRPLLITNLIGIILPISSPLLHLKNLFSFPSVEVSFVLPFAAPYLSPSKSFSTETLPPPPDYDDDSSWAALWPRVDTADLSSKGWYRHFKTDLDQGLNQPDQQQQPPEDSIASQDTARCDVFYLHPTTYFSGKGWNAPHDEESAALMVDEGILFQQAAAFHNGCRIYAPRYRQMTGTGYVDRVNGDLALDVAYEDIKRAFESFMFRRQTECMRSIILASHSQGTTLMERLLLEYFGKDSEESKARRKLLVAAYLIGMEVHDGPYSYSTKKEEDSMLDELAAKEHGNVLLPLCETKTQIGCVIAYRSFLSKPDHCKKFLNRPLISDYSTRINQRIVCTNPLSWSSMSENEEKNVKDVHLGCMPITHPWANAHYVLYGEKKNESSYERLNGRISGAFHFLLSLLLCFFCAKQNQAA